LLAGLIVTAAAKEGSMTLNICEMPGRELTGQIVKHYLEFGSVISVKIRRLKLPRTIALP